METSQHRSQDVDHLGIVAGMCYRVGLMERIKAKKPRSSFAAATW